jgi:ribosomal protein L37E
MDSCNKYLFNQQRLGKRKCKICGERFQKTQPLQMVCSIECSIEYSKRAREKAWQKEKKVKKIELDVGKNKKLLGSEINRLARMIDIKFYGKVCIDCGSPVEGQGDGCHFHNVGGNDNVRYNLHNIHLGRAYCNQYSSEHKKNYPIGIKNRYGQDYLDYLENKLRQENPYMGLTAIEVVKKLKIVRKIIRRFDSYKLKDSLHTARS